ncbi:biotin/lipoyl-binding protein [Klebsiella aerogenes]|uniref:biotin/lipoyl-binding protein n=1 Tax=Klebsiella aerogenes TaxID=548 RepID=UPI002181EB32|nr:biotin/lipoyl-binding protein [Klebsiella aerogenes]
MPLSIAASGAIAAWQEAIISPEANGLRVEKLLAEEGDVVRKGQPLAEFSHDTVMNNYLLAIAERNEANALAQNAQADALRARKLRGTGTLSEQDIHKLLTQELATKGRLMTV